MRVFLQKYIWNILIALDQLGNVVFLCGDPDETISSNTAKNLHRWGFRHLGATLEWLDPGHLKRSLEPDEGGDALALAANLRLAQGLADHVTPYRDNDNVIHQLSPMEILELWQMAAAFVEAVYSASWAIKDDPNGISPDFKVDPRWP